MMLASTESLTHSHNENWGGSAASEATLIEQLALATRELRTREAVGDRTEEIRAVIRSIRSTLTSIAERGEVQDLSRADFTVRCPEPGSLELWYRGRRLSADVRLLRETLGTAGVSLRPGQVLLADREWARRVIEESLVGLSLEELRLREGKAALLRALHDVSGASAHFW